MLAVELAVLVCAGGGNAAFFQIDKGGHAAAVEVVDPAAVVSKTNAGEDDGRLPARFCHGDKTQRVDRQGVDARIVLVLDHKLLYEKLPVLQTGVVAGAKVVDLRGVEQLDAASAGAVERLDHKLGIAPAKIVKGLEGCLAQIQPFSAVKPVKALQKRRLVIEQGPILGRVEPLDILVVFAARHIGGALGGGERVKFKEPVVGVARAVLDSAAHHVEQHRNFGAAAPLRHRAHGGLQTRDIHICHPANQVLQLAQRRALLS